VSDDPRRDFTFDELARGVANGTITRRRALKLFGATVVASLLPAGAAQAAPRCREEGEGCRYTVQCCRGLVCRRRNVDGRRRRICVEA
jgi:hypothetical protein